MKTQLYNIETCEFISKPFTDGYFVDGQKPTLPDNIVELELIYNSIPDYNPNLQKITKIDPVIDFATQTYTTGWQIIDLTQYEKEMLAWERPEYSIKIIADSNLVFDDFGLKMKAWFELQKMPIISHGDITHLYCNSIEERFLSTVTTWAELQKIQIVYRPINPNN